MAYGAYIPGLSFKNLCSWILTCFLTTKLFFQEMERMARSEDFLLCHCSPEEESPSILLQSVKSLISLRAADSNGISASLPKEKKSKSQKSISLSVREPRNYSYCFAALARNQIPRIQASEAFHRPAAAAHMDSSDLTAQKSLSDFFLGCEEARFRTDISSLRLEFLISS